MCEVELNLYPGHSVYQNDMNGNGLVLAGNGLVLAENGFGRGTQRKIMRGIKKGGRIALGMTEAFESSDQISKARALAQIANTTNQVIQGSGPCYEKCLHRNYVKCFNKNIVSGF